MDGANPLRISFSIYCLDPIFLRLACLNVDYFTRYESLDGVDGCSKGCKSCAKPSRLASAGSVSQLAGIWLRRTLL